MDWHNKDFQAWVAEVVGIENNVPLAHHHKQRYMSITLKNPNMQYPGPSPKRSITMNTMSTQKVVTNSAVTEESLLGQYDRDLKNIEEKKAAAQQKIMELTELSKTLTKKRNALAKIIATGT